MASCLGICVGKNLIKYAKASKDKGSLTINIQAYGVKFYDILTQTIAEIVQETKSEDAQISVVLTSDAYEYTECFKTMSKKERSEFLQSQFEEICNKKGINASGLDVRFIFADNMMNPEQDKVFCISVSKVELTNMWQALSNNNFASITGIGTTVVNLLKDKGINENALIINIEDETKLTLVSFGKIQELIQIPVGMDEVISRLADRYNSYAKAYEQCKGIDAYADADYSLDDESQSIRDVLMPTLYDLKQRIAQAVEPFKGNFTNVYITGTGIIVNNIDLYLSEIFTGKKVELLVPYFVNKERNSLKDVLETNSALAASVYCLNGIVKEDDFLVSGNYLKSEVNKKQFKLSNITARVGEKINELNQKTLKPKKHKKKNNKKKDIEFENEVENLEQLGGAGEFSAPLIEEEVEYYDPISEMLIRVSLSLVFAIVAYTFVVYMIQTSLNKKIEIATNNIAQTDYAIDQVGIDRTLIQKQADGYKNKVTDLERVIGLARAKQERSYDVPNFMSQLMFIIPVDVKVTSFSIGTNDTIILEAESGRYAQLGYFVSRLKLAGIIRDLDMEVISMNSNIKIKVNGVLP